MGKGVMGAEWTKNIKAESFSWPLISKAWSIRFPRIVGKDAQEPSIIKKYEMSRIKLPHFKQKPPLNE